MVTLQQLKPTDGRAFYDMLQRIEPEAYAMHNEVNGATYGEYEAWLQKMDAWARAQDLPEGYVKQVTYWLMDEQTPVGYVRLRFELTDRSREYGGSFGYAIDPLYRRRGYGTQLIRALLDIAKKENIPEFMSMVAKDNVPSNRIMEKCGGQLIRQSDTYNYYTF